MLLDIFQHLNFLNPSDLGRFYQIYQSATKKGLPRPKVQFWWFSSIYVAFSILDWYCYAASLTEHHLSIPLLSKISNMQRVIVISGNFRNANWKRTKGQEKMEKLKSKKKHQNNLTAVLITSLTKPICIIHIIIH